MKILNGECVEIMQTMDSESIDMILTSPPYDSLRDYDGYSFDFRQTAIEMYRVLKKGGVCVWVVGDATISGSESGTSFMQALYFKEIGMRLHDTQIFLKTNPMPSISSRYIQAFEYMFVFSKGAPKTFTPLRIESKHAGRRASRTIIAADGSRKHQSLRGTYADTKMRTNVFEYSVGTLRESRWKHPAKFPLQLAIDQIQSWSNEGETILDPFLGSGTTLAACKELDRNGIGIEISPEYCEIARKRIGI